MRILNQGIQVKVYIQNYLKNWLLPPTTTKIPPTPQTLNTNKLRPFKVPQSPARKNVGLSNGFQDHFLYRDTTRVLKTESQRIKYPNSGVKYVEVSNQLLPDRPKPKNLQKSIRKIPEHLRRYQYSKYHQEKQLQKTGRESLGNIYSWHKSYGK